MKKKKMVNSWGKGWVRLNLVFRRDAVYIFFLKGSLAQ